MDQISLSQCVPWAMEPKQTDNLNVQLKKKNRVSHHHFCWDSLWYNIIFYHNSENCWDYLTMKIVLEGWINLAQSPPIYLIFPSGIYWNYDPIRCCYHILMQQEQFYTMNCSHGLKAMYYCLWHAQCDHHGAKLFHGCICDEMWTMKKKQAYQFKKLSDCSMHPRGGTVPVSRRLCRLCQTWDQSPNWKLWVFGNVLNLKILKWDHLVLYDPEAAMRHGSTWQQYDHGILSEWLSRCQQLVPGTK